MVLYIPSSIYIYRVIIVYVVHSTNVLTVKHMQYLYTDKKNDNFFLLENFVLLKINAQMY